MQYRIYYLFVLLALIYLLFKHKTQLFLVFIILIFFNGFFAFLGKEIWNIYKIVILLISVIFISRYNLLNIAKTKFVKFSFYLFSITFILTAYLNGDYFIIIFSQYAKYFILFVGFLFLYKVRNIEADRQVISKIIFEILLFQIVFSIIKYFTIGMDESTVGSISEQGGAAATSLPVLGYIFLWLKRNGYLRRKDWIFILGLIFIGFVSLKRAMWFIMPIIIGLFMLYVPGKRISFRLVLLGLLAVPMVFYFGVRLSPTLNPENKIGGIFDFNYVLDYAQKYNLGEENSDKKSGRANAAAYIYNKISTNSITKTEWLGYGLRYMYTTDYEEFRNLDLGITNKGSATGVFQTMVVSGFLGILTTVLFALSMLVKTNNNRIKIVLIGFFFWEYIFYTGIILRDPALSFLLIYLILFSDRYNNETPQYVRDNNNLQEVK